MKILLQAPGDRASDWHAALTDALPQAIVAVWPDAPANPDYALVWKPPPELFLRVRPKRAIFNLGAGVDALMALPTRPPGVPVIRLEDAGMAAQMAEYVTLAVLRAYREADAYAAQQREGRWEQRPRLDKRDFGIGLLGFGVLGRAVVGALAPFRFPLYAWSRTPRTAPGIGTFAGASALAPFLAQARVLVCLLPATSATVGLVDRGMLQRMAAGGHLVNVARGDIVVDDDLVAMLDCGHLAGATLDVFRDEPLPPGHPFWHHPRITLTPHTSAVTLIGESIAQVAAKIRCLERGDAVSGVVDPVHGY